MGDVVEWRLFMGAVRAYASDEVFCFFGNESFGDGHRRDGYVGETESAVTGAAGEVYVTHAATGVVVVADAVFLDSTAVVDVVEQVCVAEGGKGAEEGGAVDGWHGIFEVAEAEDTISLMSDYLPYHQSYGSGAYA